MSMSKLFKSQTAFKSGDKFFQIRGGETTMSEQRVGFTATSHTAVTSAIDPGKVKLSPDFTICVIGASRGIGASIAYAYALAGASTLVLTARNASTLDTVAAKCKEIRSTITVHCETCNPALNESVEALAANIKEKIEYLDVVIVNAGFSGPVVTRITDGDPTDWKTCLEVNTLGTYHVAHHLLPILLQSEGARSFLVVSSHAAWITEGIIANAGYCISKLAQQRLVEMIANQYASQYLLTVGIHPGAVATEMALGAPEEFKKCECSCTSITRYSWEVLSDSIFSRSY